ncbi:MAG: DUF4019 domain-containing protein [Pseudoxanthomonas sp.]
MKITTLSKAAALSLSLCLTAGHALAQQAAQPAPRPAAQPAPRQAAPQLTAEQQAELARQNANMSKAAAQVIGMIDQNKTGEVWDGASTVAKATVGKDEFIKQITQDRRNLGAISSRTQTGVNRNAYPAGGAVPAGNYISVSYATRFANMAQPVRELVSFHLDSDNVWRVSGYTVR